MHLLAFAATLLALALLSPIARAEAPPLALALSDGQMRRLEQEFRDEIQALDAFARQRPAGAASSGSAERPGPWMLYGRLGPLRFRNELDLQSPGGMRFGLGGGGPRLTGRINIGIHRRFH